MQEQPKMLDTPVTPETTAQLIGCLTKLIAAYQAGQLAGLVLTFTTPKANGVEGHFDIEGMLYGQYECIEAAINETNARYATVTASAALANATPRILQ